MKDSIRESMSYFGLYWKMLMVKKKYEPVKIPFGKNKDQYFLYYEPQKVRSEKVIVWVHGGGWNAGSPKFFDFVGQRLFREQHKTSGPNRPFSSYHEIGFEKRGQMC